MKNKDHFPGVHVRASRIHIFGNDRPCRNARKEGMFCLEIVAGILANSIALLADSLDMLADAAIYGIALYAVGKPDSAKRAAALTSGIFQGVLGLLLVAEVIRRFLYGSEPTSLIMIMVGVAALAANISCLWLLRKQREGEVHIRASWIFTRTDALANLGTIFGGGLVLATRSALPDLIVGAAISLVVLYGSFEIVRDAAAEKLSEAKTKRGG
jgi:cation diffusion facilitator family transporter